MNNEEAIKILKQWNEDLSPYEDEKEGIECHNIAISALEKQIPKKHFKNECNCIVDYDVLYKSINNKCKSLNCYLHDI